MTLTPIRIKLQELYKSNKNIQKGELITFYGIVGGKNNDGGSPLITDIYLADTEEYITDHVFLSSRLDTNNDNYRILRAYKKNKLKGKHIKFTAAIYKYNYCDQYGLYITDNSQIIFE